MSWKSALFAGLLTFQLSCVSRQPWSQLNTQNLECEPFEVITIQGLFFEVSALHGFVYATGGNEKGRELAGVAVVLRQLGSREKLATSVTDATGGFQFNQVPIGWYQLETCRVGLNSVVVPVRVMPRSKGGPIKLFVGISN